ncbi:COMM domain-containing protein 8-like [Maniola jurtina]|uniref:COMM domain-containing protein 8-like n=1 Tax=Maniola jurtina TaxID=191418 RepID=UPI001E6897EB|nr:COMM domain-containing protein 8-like [Maniola jurtina]XP_045769047.1 COMM domain-containing protein 8-like [Maniola jurtina]
MEVVFNIETEEDFIHVVEEILNNLYREQNKPIKLINECSIPIVKDEIKDIIFNTDCAAGTVYELLLSRGFKKERSKTFSALIESRRNELLYATLLNYNSAHGETVTKFDWAVKLVYGTSELKKLKYPLLQLALTTLNNGHTQQRIYDIDKDMLDNMISVLESIDTKS